MKNREGGITDDQVVYVDPTIIDDKNRSGHHRHFRQTDLLSGDRSMHEICQIGGKHRHRKIKEQLFKEKGQLDGGKRQTDSLIVVEDPVEIFGTVDNHRDKGTQGHCPIEPSVEPRKNLVLGIVDPHDAIMLHKKVPNFPDQHHEKKPVQCIKLRQRGNEQYHDGSNYKFFFECAKQFRIAISAHKPRQMVPRGKER